MQSILFNLIDFFVVNLNKFPSSQVAGDLRCLNPHVMSL